MFFNESLSNLFINGRFDAEYHNPDATKYLKSKHEFVKIGKILQYWQYGSSQPLNEDEEGKKVYRLNEIENCFLKEPKKWVVLTDDQYDSLALKKDDVLFCRTNGNIKFVGRCGIVKESSDAVFASYLFRVRTNRRYVLPEYLVLYLTSKIGRAFIERQAMHSNQFNVSAEQLRKIPIPLLEMNFQKKVKQKVEEAYELIKKSKEYYQSAEYTLLKETDLLKYNPDRKLSYQTKLSDMFKIHRLDAEYFQPIFEDIVMRLQKRFRLEKLGNLGVRNTVKIEPDISRIYKYIEIGDIGIETGDVNYTERQGSELPSNARIPITGGELLISKVRSTRGAIGISPKKLGDNVVCSSAFSVFKIDSPMREFLFVILRTMIGKLQLEKPATGTQYPVILDEDVENIQIPILPSNIQKEISKLIIDGNILQNKSQDIISDTILQIEKTITTI